MSTDAKKVNERLVSLGPGKTVLMPDIYAEEIAVEEPKLEIADAESTEFDEAGGFNPYDTATLYKK
jgi:hypothetical protein